MNFGNLDHYFNKNIQYKTEGMKVLEVLLDKLSKKEKNALLNGLQKGNGKFIENQYLQYAVETTINYFFKTNFNNFIYEPKASNGNKNMDCGIEIDNLKINFEVKCPSISRKDERVLHIQAIGFDNPQTAEEKTKEPINAIKNLLSNNTKSKYKQVLAYNEIGGAKNKSSDLLTLLTETHLKAVEGEVNILVVSLYSKYNFNEWVNYYWDIIIDKNNKTKFQNVDGIIFTNTINHHVNNLESSSFPWSLEKHLLFFIRNPLKNNKIITLIEEKIKDIFGDNILLLQKEMMEFDKRIKSKVILNKAKVMLDLNRKVSKHPLIYTNEYICMNIDLFKNEILEYYQENKKAFEDLGITNLNEILDKIFFNIETNINMREERIERLFLCSKLIDKIESKEEKFFFEEDKYIYKKER